MSRKIITISREFGSGGRFIGEEVSKKLGIAYYDKDIIAKVAKKSGLDSKFIEQRGEYSATKSIFAYGLIARNSDGSSIEDYIYRFQRDLILELAEKEPCVIIGRCADFILRERKDCVNFFLFGNEKEKTERIMRLYELSETDAKKLMKDTDKKRSNNYNYYTDQKWGNMKNYTLSMNTSEIGYDACVDIICDLYHR